MTLSRRFVTSFLDTLLTARAENQGAAPKVAKLGSTVKDLERPSRLSRFGALLRLHRLAAGLSQEALAERARMSSNGVGALERGYRRAPRRQTLVLLVDALRLDDHDREQFELAARIARLAGDSFTRSGFM